MSSRAEEKERRRQERVAREQEAQRAAARRRTLQIGGGALLGLAVIAAVVVVLLAGGGNDDSADTTKLAADAKAAGCTFKSWPMEGRTHSSGTVNYKTNPPTSGNHNPTPAQDGFYREGNSPPKENFVHSLEHGRIEFQYKPGTPAADIARLRRLAEEPLNGSAGYHVLFFENNTKMPTQFAATGWTKSITCSQLTTQSLNAMREFRKAFTDKGPEVIP